MHITYVTGYMYRDYNINFMLFCNRCCSIKLNCHHPGSCNRSHVYRDCFNCVTIKFTIILTILLKSKRALHVELDLLKAKMKEQPVIYEEIGQLQDSLKSSSPTIDVGENTNSICISYQHECLCQSLCEDFCMNKTVFLYS